jgi:hypothetical protein
MQTLFILNAAPYGSELTHKRLTAGRSTGQA